MADVSLLEGQTPDLQLLESERVHRKVSSSPCMAKLDRLAWASCDWFEIDGYRFGVRTTSFACARWIGYVLASYRADGPSELDQDPLFALVVEDDSSVSGRTGRRLHILYEGTADIVRTMDVRAVARSFLHELEAVTFPTRDDAVYLEASVMQGRGGTVLIPWLMVPPINTTGRQIRRKVDLVMPGTVSVALDLDGGHLSPVRRTLDIPDDALDVLGDYVPVGSAEDARAMVDNETPIDRVLIFGGGDPSGSFLAPAARGPALFKLAGAIRNLGALGGRSLEAVGNVVATADVLETRWTNRRELIDIVAAAANGDHYVPERTEGTPAEP